MGYLSSPPRLIRRCATRCKEILTRCRTGRRTALWSVGRSGYTSRCALGQRSLRPWRMSLQIVALRLLAFVVFLLLWWAASVFSGSSLVPTPFATAQAAGKLFGQERIYRATLESLSIYASGFTVAAIVAIPLGLVMGGFRILGRTLNVYVNALSATPRVAFIPLIIGLLGLGFNAKVTVVF